MFCLWPKVQRYISCGKRSILRPSRYYLYMSIVSLGDTNALLDNPPGTVQHPKKNNMTSAKIPDLIKLQI